ncbi:MAG: divalent metal cation transporter [Candidatus Neomarinimicrobiota bacterium]|nr:MAG: divalent metal cation transporter [Candidatus Neomarinimicrobiota bacterium]
MHDRKSDFWKALGPGLLWAGASIGVSHLVQSTRAGATYNFSLVWLVILAMVMKYPFFEFGPRYASATGKSLLKGYLDWNPWAWGIFLVMTVGTMFAVMAAVTVVTAGLAIQLFPFGWSILTWCALLLVICAAILALGQYALLDSAIKIIIVILSLSTVIAVAAAFLHGPAARPGAAVPSLWTLSGVSFMVVLLGWMPCPIDVAVWHSLWTLERRKQTGVAPAYRNIRLDFDLGYYGTGVMALGFLSLGALVMFGSGETFARSGGAFAGQLVELYTKTLGSWSHLVILLAAFTTMFSTTLTVADAYPRVLKEAWLDWQGRDRIRQGERVYWLSMLGVIAGGLLLLTVLKSTMTFMVDLATTLSFLTAPVLAWFNYRVLFQPDFPEAFRPSRRMQILSWIGMAFLLGFALVYLYWRFFRI